MIQGNPKAMTTKYYRDDIKGIVIADMRVDLENNNGK